MSYAIQISNLTGLDEETVKSQILPHLETFKDKGRLQAHLEDLLGTKPSARNVISSYITSRFVPTNVSSPATSNPSSRPSSRNAGPSRSGASTPQPLSGKPIIRQAPPKKPKTVDPAGGSMLSDSLGGGGSTKAVKPESFKKEKEGPKSEEVEKIEGLMRNVELSGADGEGLGKRALKKGRGGGCFCQARIHPLSVYTPLCLSCSLPLCILQLPHLPCPSCSSHLLTPTAKTRLLSTLRSELAQQLAREQAERDRIAEEAREKAWTESGGGRFPTLASGIVGGTASTGATMVKKEESGRKVLSLNGKTGKARVQTFVPKPPPPPPEEIKSRGEKPVEEEDTGRIGPPLMIYLDAEERKRHCEGVLRERRAKGRFFLDVGGLEMPFVEARVLSVGGDDDGEGEDGAGQSGEKKRGKKRGRGKGKGKEKEGTEEIDVNGAGTDAAAKEGSSTGRVAARGEASSVVEPPAGEGLDDLTPEERAFIGLANPTPPPPASRPSSKPPNPSTPAFQPKSQPNASRQPPPSPRQQQPSSRQPPPHLSAAQSTPSTSNGRALPPYLSSSSGKTSQLSSPPQSSSTPPTSSSPSATRYTPNNPPPSRLLKSGVHVLLIKKEDQPTGKTTAGEIKDVLSSGDHPRGVKVRCKNGIVGRVVELL